MFKIFDDAWRYRIFIFDSIIRNYKIKYKNERSAYIWVLIYPLIQVLIFTLILSNAFGAKIPGLNSQGGYPLYLLSGMLAWTIISELVISNSKIFFQYGGLLKKNSLPIVCLVAIQVGSIALDSIIMLVLLVITKILLTQELDLTILWALILFPLTLMISAQVGFFLGMFNVFFSEISIILPLIFQILFWLTPIAYPVQILPTYMQTIVGLNPLTKVVEDFHAIFVYQEALPYVHILAYFSVVIILYFSTKYVFKKTYNLLLDEL